MSEAALMLAAALAAAIAAIACAIAALSARSLFVTAAATGACASAGAAAILAFGADSAALGLALLGAGLAPMLLLAAMLLSARSVRGGQPIQWGGIAAGALALGALIAGSDGVSAAPKLAALAEAPDITPWLAVLVFVAVAACVGLLGYGERGAFQRARERRE